MTTAVGQKNPANSPRPAAPHPINPPITKESHAPEQDEDENESDVLREVEEEEEEEEEGEEEKKKSTTDVDKPKVDRTSKAKRAEINISVGKIRHAIQARGIQRISDGVDVRVAAFIEEMLKQLWLHAYGTLRETRFGCAHILSVSQNFTPFKSLKLNLQHLCVPMLSTASFEMTREKNKNGYVLPHFSNPVSVRRHNDEVIIETKQSSREIIQDLQKRTGSDSLNFNHFVLGFNHTLTNKGKRQTSLHDKDTKTTGKLEKLTKKEKGKKKVEVGASKKRKHAELTSPPGSSAEVEDDAPLKKKAKKVKGTKE